MEGKQDIETVEYSAERRRSSLGRRASNVSNNRHIDYVDHRENDDRADEAKGRDAAAFGGNYWYSKNFIGTMLAIGFSFMAGIGGMSTNRSLSICHPRY